ncbi:Response regulator receiver domain-containing protein [Loktanella sp. DSM 29012]|uniref:response regulator n=1 Tax=Loktanella sp. DSM 29012 TaxID=1881056 RepID=UPI0008B8EBD0|nr:response regulator [Loktanella sp. DSM 29012]SEP97807.1 Response regulator receiver domain-containing protein [Loktanella sp. DSM 29012]
MIKILHAEDDPDIREIAELALGMSGQFEILQCADGQMAVDHAADFAPDVLLLDVMMPNMTGPEVLATLRKDPALSDVPAIFMTARVQSVEKQALLDQGAVAVIAKPFDPITLADDIMAALKV